MAGGHAGGEVACWVELQAEPPVPQGGFDSRSGFNGRGSNARNWQTWAGEATGSFPCSWCERRSLKRRLDFRSPRFGYPWRHVEWRRHRFLPSRRAVGGRQKHPPRLGEPRWFSVSRQLGSPQERSRNQNLSTQEAQGRSLALPRVSFSHTPLPGKRNLVIWRLSWVFDSIGTNRKNLRPIAKIILGPNFKYRGAAP